MFGERIELVEPLPDQVDILKILGARPGAYHFAFEVEGSAEDLSSLATSRKLLPTMVERPAQAFPRSTVSFYIAMDGSLLEFIRREP